MATITVTLPEGVTLSQGKQISFTAPCDSTGVTGIIINNVTYTLLKANGDSLETGAFISGALVSVLIDLTNHKAYIQNAASAITFDDVGDNQTLLTEHKDTIVGAVNELFTNVSNGKQLIAASLTDMKISSSGDDTFEKLALDLRQVRSVGSVKQYDTYILMKRFGFDPIRAMFR